MRTRILVLCICLLAAWQSFSQTINYDWSEKPSYPVTEEDRKVPVVYLKEVTILEFYYAEQHLVNNKFYHRAVLLNSDEAINSYNKIYLPMSSDDDLRRHKARVISPDGSVKELDEKSIQEATDEESQQKYRFFALDGLTKGSIVEYFYSMTEMDYLGAREVFQSDVLKKNVEFRIITPKNIIFATKSYNGCPVMEEDTSIKEQNVRFLKIDRVPEVKKEEFALYAPNLMQVVYKLDKNTNNNRKDIINYKAIAQTYWDIMHEELDKPSEKAITKLITKDLKIDPNGVFETNIRLIENYIKTSLMVHKGVPTSTIAEILKNKVTNDNGVTKLYAHLFDRLNIEYELVITSDRYKIKFDPDFQAYNFLDRFLFYFPDIKKYLDPEDQIYRLGLFSYHYNYNYGLFVKTVTLGDFKSGTGEVRFIDAPDFQKSKHNIYVDVTFGANMATTNIELQVLMDGYYASGIQPYYDYMKEEQIRETNESIVKDVIKNANITEVTVENKGQENFCLKPLVLKATLTSDETVENAGNKYLFKVGEMIGPQMEMYQKEERKFPVENDYNRTYHREIKFRIPEGYVIKNPDAMKMDVFYEEKGERQIAFTSTYTIKGDQVEVVVDEYYKRIAFPLALFEQYRKVINAAADFNKVVLIFEKK